MSSWRENLTYYSRSRRVLWMVAATTLGLGALVAWLAGQRTAPEIETARGLVAQGAYGERPADGPLQKIRGGAFQAFERIVQDRRFGLWDCLETVPILANALEESQWTKAQALVAERFGAEAGELFFNYLQASFDSFPEATDRLKELAESNPPVRYANRILSHLALSRNLKREAAEYLEREGAFRDALAERRRAVELYTQLDDAPALRRLAREPRFEDAFSVRDRLEMAIEDRDWLSATKQFALIRFTGIGPGLITLVLASGVVWWLLLFKLGQQTGGPARSSALSVCALLLGMASVVPTLLLGSVLEAYFGFGENGETINDLAFFIVGVGLKEELVKLVFFLPLLPLLNRRGNELEMLIVAGFVGLGFAVAENIGYLASTSGLAAVPRFLTANFFHIGMTALCGLYLCRSMVIRGYDYTHFLYIFGLVSVAHGVYDSLLSIAAFADMSFLAYSVYIILSQRFFAEAHHLRESRRTVLSLSAVFTVGVCLVCSVSLVYLTGESGFENAFQAIGPASLGTALIAIMFFREFREELYP